MEMPESTIMANGRVHTVAVGNPACLNVTTTPEGVVRTVANRAGGVVTVTDRLIPWGESERIQFCQYCGTAYSAHSYPGACFGCAVGLT